MTTTEKNIHPSNRLYRGEVTDFLEAMDLYRAQMEHENHLTRKSSRELNQPLTDDDKRFMKSLSEAGVKAGVAAGIYLKHQRAIIGAVVGELRGLGGDEFNAFADALESGDYSQLAI